MSEVEERVLAAVDNDDLGFEYAGSRIYYHWWLSEHERRRLTAAERRCLLDLIDQGVLERVHGVQHGRGGICRAPAYRRRGAL